MSDLDSQIAYILEKLQKEFEVVKRQGFPARQADIRSRYAVQHDAAIPEPRWRAWERELGIDYAQLEAILKIIKKEGMLENFKFISDYV